MRQWATYMARDRVKVMTDARHVAPDILATVVNARVLETEEGDLDKLASAQRHVPRVFSSDAELEEVELVDILEEGSRVSDDLAGGIAANANRDVLDNGVQTVGQSSGHTIQC